MMTVITPVKACPGPYALLNVTADGVGSALDCSLAQTVRLYVMFSKAAVSGGVQIETSVAPDDSAEWAPLGDPISASPGAIPKVELPGPLDFVRARITTPITGGTVAAVAFTTFAK
jgi:hypothetical protein